MHKSAVKQNGVPVRTYRNKIKFRKAVSLVFSLALALALMAGCSEKSASAADYPVMETADISGIMLSTALNKQLQAAYPADAWTEIIVLEPLTLMYKETTDTTGAVNVNIQVHAEYSGSLTEKGMDGLLESLESYDHRFCF